MYKQNTYKMPGGKLEEAIHHDAVMDHQVYVAPYRESHVIFLSALHLRTSENGS